MYVCIVCILYALCSVRYQKKQVEKIRLLNVVHISSAISLLQLFYA